MCCIDVDPIAFLDWAKPILEKKEENRAKVRKECDAEITAWKTLPWYRRWFTTAPFDNMFWEEDKLILLGHYRLPSVYKNKYIPLANYCAARGIMMPLESGHDFFKG